MPTAKELADAERYSWARIPTYDHMPSDRLTSTLNGGTTHGQSTWRDTAGPTARRAAPECARDGNEEGPVGDARLHVVTDLVRIPPGLAQKALQRRHASDAADLPG
ncbi:hypothetical protein [Streptomyces sp. 769]|uniref:hypothetical protein n=1 Tax=Streptomyces sp. 769 TaxID=1262452 RepID=UPI00057C937A|nr:hypothetical protein [Streptomyces sp. 769]AJC54849.1 hypothetical protein GZL_02256 [Streptomyces sp. 769]